MNANEVKYEILDIVAFKLKYFSKNCTIKCPNIGKSGETSERILCLYTIYFYILYLYDFTEHECETTENKHFTIFLNEIHTINLPSNYLFS